MAMKRAILINSLYNGGAEKVVSVIVNELCRQNYNIELICLEKNNFYKIDNRVKITYLSNFKGTESSLLKLIYLPIFALKLKKYIKQNNIFIVQSHIYRANYVNLMSKIFGAKHETQIVNVGLVSRYKKEGFLGKINLLLVKWLYKYADLIICKSFQMLEDMTKYVSIAKKGLIIYNPYDISLITQLAEEDVDNFNFDPKKKYVVSVGRLIPLKRNADLINALTLLPDNVEALFIGDGEEKEDLIDLAKMLKVEKRCHFLGRVENPFKYMLKCDVFVLCSETEGFPNVLVEAMICGLPVISTDCKSGPREILAPKSDLSLQVTNGVEYSDYGILVPVSGIKEIAEAINSIAFNIELRNKYVCKGRERANDFSLEKIIKEYKEVLNI